MTGVPRSTANDICRHALANVMEKREEEREKQMEQDFVEETEEEEENENEEISLLDLIAADCLDPKPRPGRPQELSAAEKNTLLLQSDADTTHGE